MVNAGIGVTGAAHRPRRVGGDDIGRQPAEIHACKHRVVFGYDAALLVSVFKSNPAAGLIPTPHAGAVRPE